MFLINLYFAYGLSTLESTLAANSPMEIEPQPAHHLEPPHGRKFANSIWIAWTAYWTALWAADSAEMPALGGIPPPEPSRQVLGPAFSGTTLAPEHTGRQPATATRFQNTDFAQHPGHRETWH